MDECAAHVTANALPPTGPLGRLACGDRRIDRRQLLLLLLGGTVALAGCAGPPGPGPTSGAASSPGSATSGGSGTAAPTPSSSLPSSAANGGNGPTADRPLWTPDANDVSPQVKLIAAEYVETTVNEPAVQVVFAQYGGILSASASVLVVTHPWPLAPDRAAGTTYDVRLVRSGSSWRVTEIHPSTPGPAAANLSGAARAVLAEPRIDLAPAGRADVASGQVHDTVLQALLTLAQTYRIGVSVVRSGHPIDVFGTSRPSDHPVGRAFDTWRIDDQGVVSASTPRSLVTAYMQAAARAGSYNVGGPYSLSGSTYFTDNTHHDHVHAGFQA